MGADGERVCAGGGRERQGRGLHQRWQGPAAQIHCGIRHRASDHHVNCTIQILD